jgi:NUMOD3 motif
MTPGGDGGAGKKLSASQIAKIRERVSGPGNPMAGRFGKDHPVYGYRKTEEQKKRISLAHKGKNVRMSSEKP